jgi:hypothetical protein
MGEFVLDVIAVGRLTDDEKDLEILLLRQQLRIVERKQERGPQIPRWQMVPLVALVRKNTQSTLRCTFVKPLTLDLELSYTSSGWI